MIDILIICLKPMLYFLWKPWTYCYLLPIVMVGFIADVIMNNTIVPLVLGGGWLQELTFSQRLERLCVDFTNTDVQLYIQIAKKINRICPTHDHIKAVL